MGNEVRVDPRFNGPPAVANGGYACALVAAVVGGPATVTLRRPVPVGVGLTVVGGAAGASLLRDGELLAEGVPAGLPAAERPAVDLEAARAAAARYEGAAFAGQFPCFVCGAERHAPDGLEVHPGPVAGADVVASPWVPHESTATADGLVTDEVVWAVLDCTATWGAANAFGTGPAMLGRLAAGVVRRPAVGEQCVAVGWGRSRDGRKLLGGAALYTAGGELLAVGHATCILPRDS